MSRIRKQQSHPLQSAFRLVRYTDQSQPKLSNWQQDRAFLCCLHLSIRRGKNDFINSSSDRIQYLTVVQARRTLKTDLNTDHGMVSFFLSRHSLFVPLWLHLSEHPPNDLKPDDLPALVLARRHDFRDLSDQPAFHNDNLTTDRHPGHQRMKGTHHSSEPDERFAFMMRPPSL